MRLFSKNTHTLIVSLISSILLFIYPNITQSQVYAISDPLSVPNNRFGIHIIQATPDESSPAAILVNSSGGDWGYITVLIEGKDKNKDKWQTFFNDLRRRHLIPIVRIATEPEGNSWKRPDPDNVNSWVDFLDDLNWPTKNRYVVIFNEPNHATEWGNKVDAKSYAEALDKFITTLKSKNSDFFVLNAGFDASSPSKAPLFEDELNFTAQMNQAVPGIFDRLDGWVSHSYPNPGFAGSPNGIGRGTVRTWYWEIQQLRNLGVSKNLPVFITETGWKHAEGINYDVSFPPADTIAGFYKQAFEGAWSNNRIVAVTPFLLSYQEFPFDHFSFKKISSPDYYSVFQTITDLPKITGHPLQDNLAKLIKGEVYSSIVSGENYNISLTLQNSGQSIWDESVKLVALEGGKELGINGASIPKSTKIEPGQEYTFNLSLKAPQSGKFKVKLNLLAADKPFDSNPLQFTTEVKSPVILKIKSLLDWKSNFSGNYTLSINGATGKSLLPVSLDSSGGSKELEARYLLPDYVFEFSLEKPFYVPKTLHQKVYTGINLLDFGTLQPDLFSALFNPQQLWKLLPFSN